MRRVVPVPLLLVLAGAAWLLLRAPSAGDAVQGEVPREEGGRGLPDEARLEGRASAPGGVEPEEPEAVAAGPGARDLVVRVWRYHTGECLVGAEVAVVDAAGHRLEAVTGGNGEVVLSGLPVGPARVALVWPGWIAETVEVEVEAEDETYADLYPLRAVQGRGRVLTAAHGAPVAGARVVAAAEMTVGDAHTTRTGDVWCVERTDATGRFRLPAVPLDETFTVTVLADGYAREIRNFVYHEEGATPEIEIRLHPGGSLGGVVVDRAGVGVPGALVFAYPDGDQTLARDPRGGWSDGTRVEAALSARSDETGRFEIQSLALLARYAVTAFDDASLRAEDVKGLVLTETEPTRDVRLVLPDPATLEVRVLGPEDEALPGCEVKVVEIQAGIPMYVDEATTDAAGLAVLRRLGAGEVVVRVESEVLLPEQTTVLLEEGRTRSLRVCLQRGVAVTGVVVDEEGRPLEGLEVYTWNAAALRQSAVTTDAEGRFRLDGLAPRTHALRAWGRGYATREAVQVEAPATDVRLVCGRPARVHGRLVPPPGVPVPERLSVGCMDARGAGYSSYAEWGGGRFEVWASEDSSVLVIQGEGFAPLRREISVAPGEVLDLGEVVLSPGVACGGVVVAASGAPVRGAAVIAIDHEWRATQTDEAGRFRVEHLDPGDLRLSVEAEGFLPRVADARDGVPGEGLRLVLSRGGLLRVRLLDGEGLPVVEADVYVAPADVDPEEDEDAYYERTSDEMTDARGRIAVRLPPGRYTLEAVKDEQTLARAEATLEEGKTTEVELKR